MRGLLNPAFRIPESRRNISSAVLTSSAKKFVDSLVSLHSYLSISVFSWNIPPPSTPQLQTLKQQINRWNAKLFPALPNYPLCRQITPVPPNYRLCHQITPMYRQIPPCATQLPDLLSLAANTYEGLKIISDL